MFICVTISVHDSKYLQVILPIEQALLLYSSEYEHHSTSMPHSTGQHCHFKGIYHTLLQNVYL